MRYITLYDDDDDIMYDTNQWFPRLFYLRNHIRKRNSLLIQHKLETTTRADET